MIRRRLEQRRKRKFEEACDRLGIPEDVRVRIRRSGIAPPAAGRQEFLRKSEAARRNGATICRF